MDTIKILGSLLGNNAMGSGVGGTILDSLLKGSGGGKSGAGGILGSLLGGGKRSSGGGLGALGAILAAAAASQMRKGGSSGGGGAMDILGSLIGGGAQSGGLGGLGDLLGGGGGRQQSGGSGGLGDLLGGVLGGGSSQQQQSGGGGGGLGDLLGGILGGSSSGGGLFDMLGAKSLKSPDAAAASGSDLLGMFLGGGQQKVAPPKEAHDEAEILIQAMCNAAKSDGRIDQSEQEAVLGKIGELDSGEAEYLREQLTSPLDLQGFLDKVPSDMAEQVYAFSLMAVRLDTQQEAQYFAKLASGLGIDGDTANEIHEQLGQPEIFA